MRVVDDQPIRRPRQRQPCRRDQPEARGPGIYYAGLCVDCGLATIRYDQAGGERVVRCHGQHSTAGDQP